MPLKKQKILAVAIFLIFVSGCGRLPSGVGIRPEIQIGPKPEFSEEEKIILSKFSSDYPTISIKIIGRNNEQAEAIDKYNALAKEHNVKVLNSIGLPSEDINKLYPKK